MTARPMELSAPVSGGRIAGALLGGALLGLGRRVGGRFGALASLAGASVLARTMARPAVNGIRRAAEARRSVRLRTIVHIRRPVHDVFTFCKDFENFPRVVGAVRSVVDYQDGRSHWEVYTPSGSVLSWDAVVTKYVPNSVVAWESVVHSVVESTGVVRFTPLSTTRTRVDLSVTHHPVRTSLKDAVRALLASDPRKTVTDNLDHIRFYLESMPPERSETAPQSDRANVAATTEMDSQPGHQPRRDQSRADRADVDPRSA